MIGMWSSNIPFLLYATAGGIVLIPFAASAFAQRNRQYWALALGLAVAAAALNVAIELAHQSNRSENILNRDIGAIAALAFACPVISAFFAVQVARKSALTRTTAATAVVVAFMFVAPFFVLIAHCTSGDCL